MPDIILSEKQAAGVKKIKEWFCDLEQNCPRKEDYDSRERFDFSEGHQQIFRVFGYAGTGKSTLVEHAIKELSLSSFSEVLFGTFTGKAAYVLRRKGVPTAQTIHSMIYAVSEATEAQVNEQREKIEKLRIALSTSPGEQRLNLQAQIAAEEQKLRDMKKPSFGLSPNSPVPGARLVVLDEVSMVGEDMAADLLSFGKPILVLGDPGQLPPIKGEGAFTQVEPDVMLTEIHRQAAESPIIRLATLAREGRRIDFGRYSDEVWKMRRSDVEPAHLLQSDQVICGMNATRLMLNNALRQQSGLAGAIPSGDAEKIICLRNDGEKGLINGMFLTLSDVDWDVDKPELYFFAVVHDEEGNQIGGKDQKGGPRKLGIYAGHFLDHVVLDKERADRDWRDKRKFTEATYGWAITAHKAQGSSWGNVVVWDDGLGRTREDRQRWLYTAITRAESGLLLLD